MDNKQLNFISNLFTGDDTEYSFCQTLQSHFRDLKYIYSCVDSAYFFAGHNPNRALSRAKRVIETNRLLMFVCSRNLYDYRHKKMSDFSPVWDYNNSFMNEVSKDKLLHILREFKARVNVDKKIFEKAYAHEVIRSFYKDYENYIDILIMVIKEEK